MQGRATRLRSLLAFGVLGIAAATQAQAQVNALPPTRHVLVYGDAQAQAIPDRFRITVNFSALDTNAGAARERVERSVAAVIERLRKTGMADHDIAATSLSIEPESRYDDRQRAQLFQGTRVKRSLTASFARKQALEDFLSGLQTSQELSVSDVETEFSDGPKLREALRAKAIESTRAKATTIAGAYGVRLGALYSVSDVAPQFEYGVKEGEWPSVYQWNTKSESLDRVVVTGSRIKGAPAPPAALQVGYVTYTDRIYAVFLLAD